MFYYRDGERRWYCIAHPRQAPPGCRVWRPDELVFGRDAQGRVVVRAGRER